MTLLSCAYAGTGNVLKVSISFCQIYCNCKDFLIPNLASVIGPALSWSVCAASWEGRNLSRSCCTGNSYGIYGRRTWCRNGYSLSRASFTIWGTEYQKISPIGSWAPLHIKPQGRSRTLLKRIGYRYLLGKYVYCVNYSAQGLTCSYLFGQVNVMDTLSRLSHDADTEVAMVFIVLLHCFGCSKIKIIKKLVVITESGIFFFF